MELVPTIKDSPSPKSASPSPSPSPPPRLPLPGEELKQETFLRFLDLITPKHRQLLEKKRKERKKRSTTSTNKNEYVYGSFDMQTKKRKLNFPYLQQNIAPPTTRAQQRAKRQQQLQTARRSPPSPSPHSPAPSSSTPPDSPPPHFLNIPTGLTIIPVVSPDPMPCCVCNQNDVPSLLRHCRGCSSYFHWSCASESSLSHPECPHCGQIVKEPHSQSSGMTVIPYANKPSPSAIKEKVLEKRLLQERNQQLRCDLKKLEMRAETLKENLESKDSVKRKLKTEQFQTQKNIKKLLEFLEKFKDTASYPVHRMIKEDSKSSDSNSN